MANLLNAQFLKIDVLERTVIPKRKCEVQCPKCDDRFEEVKVVRTHLVQAHKVSFFDLPKGMNLVKKIPCKHAWKGCKQMFSTPERHLTHLRHHCGFGSNTKCEATVHPKKLDEHVQNCKFSPHNIQNVKCKYGCGATLVNEKNMPSHYKNHCPVVKEKNGKSFTCPRCKKLYDSKRCTL